MRQYDGKDIGRIGGEFGRMLDNARAISVRAKGVAKIRAERTNSKVDQFLKSIGYNAK